MAKIHIVTSDPLRCAFHCPGCEEAHVVDGRWTFNGDTDMPTFAPSYLARTESTVCHSFVKDGKIQFLNDCTHHLSGQTVELPDWECHHPKWTD